LTELPAFGSVVVWAGRTNLQDTSTAQNVEIDRARSVIHEHWTPGAVGPDDLREFCCAISH